MNREPPQALRAGEHMIFLTVITCLIVGYMMVRFGGMFASNDAGVHATAAASILETNSLTQGVSYNNGFGYPSIVAMVSAFTGLSVSALQTYVFGFMLVIPILAAYITCREILGERAGVFAAILFLLHPFFMFSAYRSTHEKFTYGLILLTIYLLYISFKTSDSSTRTRVILIGYLLIAGITFLNIYFASAFITAIAMSLGGAFIFSSYRGGARSLRRLTYTVGISMAFILLFIFFLYPPAQQFLTSLGSVSARSLVLLFGSAPSSTGVSTSPYTSVLVRWRSFTLYLLLISFYFIVYPIAGITWLNYARSVLTQESIDEGKLPDVFIYILSAAFGVLLIGAIITDQTGLLGANMQLRVFPLLGCMAIILTTKSMFNFLDRNEQMSRPGYVDNLTLGQIRQTIVPVVIILLIIGFSGTSTLKSTNDPTVSNVWTTVTEEERTTVNWVESNLNNEYLWSGFSARLRNDHRIRYPKDELKNRYDIRLVNLPTRYLILSDTMVAEANASGGPLPPRSDASVIYSNGGANVYWFEQYRPLNEYNEAWGR